MNKRGLAGRAFTLLAAVGIIALVLVGFTLTTSAFIKKQAFDIKAEIIDLDTSDQLRLLLAAVADDLERNDCSRVDQVTRDAYGPQAQIAVYRNDKFLCGSKIDLPSAVMKTVLPSYDGAVSEYRVEVKRQ
ncbi:MAG: hypothetical protein QXR48_00420 [Candidatus Woesearchaeota archaeon]